MKATVDSKTGLITGVYDEVINKSIPEDAIDIPDAIYLRNEDPTEPTQYFDEEWLDLPESEFEFADWNGKKWVEDKVKGDFSQGSNFILLIPEVNSH